MLLAAYHLHPGAEIASSRASCCITAARSRGTRAQRRQLPTRIGVGRHPRPSASLRASPPGSPSTTHPRCSNGHWSSKRPPTRPLVRQSCGSTDMIEFYTYLAQVRCWHSSLAHPALRTTLGGCMLLRIKRGGDPAQSKPCWRASLFLTTRQRHDEDATSAGLPLSRVPRHPKAPFLNPFPAVPAWGGEECCACS